MTYRYTRVTFRMGQEIARDEHTVSGHTLESEMGSAGELAFHMLINKWNRQGLIGTPASNLIYVYVAH